MKKPTVTGGLFVFYMFWQIDDCCFVWGRVVFKLKGHKCYLVDNLSSINNL